MLLKLWSHRILEFWVPPSSYSRKHLVPKGDLRGRGPGTGAGQDSQDAKDKTQRNKQRRIEDWAKFDLGGSLEKKLWTQRSLNQNGSQCFRTGDSRASSWNVLNQGAAVAGTEHSSINHRSTLGFGSSGWQMSAGGHQGHLPDSPQQKLLSKVIIRFLCILLLEMTSPGWNPCVPPIFTCSLRSPHLCP